MPKRTTIWLIASLTAALLLPATPVFAADNLPDDGVVIWNEDYTLGEGQQLDGDLVVFNGDVILLADSRVEGDAVVWNGSADIDGVVEGDLVVSNGGVDLGEDAHVQGDLVCTWNCDIEREDGARVDGDIVEGLSLRGLPFTRLVIKEDVRRPLPFWASGPEQVLRWILRAVRSAVTILVIAVVGGLVALIWPRATDQVGRTVFQSAGPSLGIGLLTVVAAIALIIALAITICLSPVAALMGLALAAAGLFGWIAIGAQVGRRLLRAFNAREVAPMWSAGLGTLAITLVSIGLSAAFCLAPLGWLLTFALGCLGLGAVMLSRFGTTPYVPGRPRETEPSTPAPVETPELAEPTAQESEDSEQNA